MTNMAAIYRGDKKFTVEDIGKTAPKKGEVQVEIAYCGICGTDLHAYLGHMDARVGFERTLGHEMSGVISAVGEGVKDIAVGDRIVVRPLDACGDCPACNNGNSHICHKLKFLGLDTNGGMQNFWNVPAHTIHKLPDNLALRDAALVEPLAVAVHDVERSKVKKGDDVLVIGGGPIGMLVAMAARAAGGKVTISEVSENRLALAKSMGFDVINPKEVDVAEVLTEATGTKGMDVVFEVSGTQPGVDLMTAAAASRGRIVMVAIHATKPQVDLFRFFWRELELVGVRVYEPHNYDEALELLSSGKIDTKAMITNVESIANVNEAFASLVGNPTAMKTLLELNGGLDK